jgi:hypothetical protein
VRLARASALAALLLAGAPSLAKDEGSRAEAYEHLPDWTGLWLTEHNTTSIGGIADSTLAIRAGEKGVDQANRDLFGFSAPWNEEGRKRQAAARAKTPGRKADGWGYPLMMDAAAPLEITISPERVVMINAYRDVRIIRTDEAGHPPDEDLWPTVWGDSVGRWEGDTLVVDTIMVKNPNDFFQASPVLSEEAHYVERIHLDKEKNLLVDEMTITDPVTLTGPWKIHLTYQHAEDIFGRMVLDAYDGDRTGTDENGVNTIEPTN